MAYRLKRKESVADGVRRIAREQVERALDALADESLPSATVVHQLRKHCKKIRALLRLVRSKCRRVQRRENRVLRDLARSLSASRDAEVARRTWAKVAARTTGADPTEIELPPALIGNGAAERGTTPEATGGEALLAARNTLLELLNRIPNWRIEGRGFDLVRDGFEASYRSGRKAMRAAVRSDSPNDFHEWRKHVKDHWYHLRLLQGVWPEVVGAERQAAHELAELLGDDHDLAVLRERLGDAPSQRSARLRSRDARRALNREHRRLGRRARRVGARLFAAKPVNRVDRMERLWNAWR